ncbi:S46 family peptidase [Aquirhabdus parva]|uniref:Dipeptidyl-peptidase n=1 Tax=Aquirhabdus parva TaxID=2283318 RepID=A0A345P4F7_9GAMM|nr:S46 family peptidase [Aquirhabdus parva]AXI02166.1 S46 family peptidase [Aquirhabdus parva]
MKKIAMAVLCVLYGPASVNAAEGMWTPNNLPTAELKEKYQFNPDPKWVTHAQKAAVRLAGGCSGSFVSPAGLVLTNHHCVNSCVQQLSTADHDFIKSGFYAKKPEDEIKCPEIELNRLDTITDVTARVKKATEGKNGEDYSKAEKAVKSDIEKECVGNEKETTRCDVVDLYHGGVYDVYKYHRYQDVRLVFAPELAIAFFGGDPDNFNFPRYDLDMGMLRAYENNKPAKVVDYFPFSKNGAEAGELTMTVGNPGGTDRQLTVSELETTRDVDLIPRLFLLSELRGVLTQFRSQGTEQSRIAQHDIFGIENSFKALKGRLQALQDPEVFNLKQKQETELRDYVKASPERQAKYGAAWDEIAKAQTTYRNIETPLKYIEYGRGFSSDYFSDARLLVRGAEERTKPNPERLREFTESKLPSVTQQLFSTAPIYPELEKVKLTFALTKLRENLGVDNPIVKSVLGKESPAVLAEKLISGTKLGDPAVRKALWEGGADAIAKSDDPFIQLVKQIDPQARAIRKQYENQVESVIDKNSELIAAARFEKLGTSVYPDATFTQRFSFGEVKGWNEKGTEIKPFTEIKGAFARATGFEPFALPASWLTAKDKLNLDQRFDLVSTNDIIGGNSGSPLINRKAELVGLVFDGNIQSLGGNYWFDERVNRTVSVHSGAILEALQKVYNADRVVKELKDAKAN